MYRKTDGAIEDIRNWYYNTYYIDLNRGQVVCYAIATAKMDDIRSLKTVSRLIQEEDMCSVGITEPAHQKVKKLAQRLKANIALTTSLIVLLKSLSLPTMSQATAIRDADKKKATSLPPSWLEKNFDFAKLPSLEELSS
jgi:hypothetical protein